MTTSPPIICILLLSSSSARLGAMETPQTPPVCNDKFLDASGIWESCSKVCGNLIKGRGSIDSLHNTNCKLLCQDCFDHYASRTTSTTQLVTTTRSDISISEYDVWKWKTTAIAMIVALSIVLVANFGVLIYKRCRQGSTENLTITQQDAEAQRNSGGSSPAGQNHSAGNAAAARAQAHAHGSSSSVANGLLVSMQGNPIASCTGDASSTWANGGTLPENSARRIAENNLNLINDNGRPVSPTSSSGDAGQTLIHIHSTGIPLERIHPLEENISYDSFTDEAETPFIGEDLSIENDENSTTPNSDDAGYTSAHTPSERCRLIEENINDSQSERWDRTERLTLTPGPLLVDESEIQL